MALRVALDFDGVCTDTAIARLYRADEHEFLYSPFSITISPPKRGIREILSVLGFFAEIFIVTSRPAEDGTFIENWLRRHGLIRLVRSVICCGAVPKAAMMERRRIHLLVDDNPKEVAALSQEQSGYLWRDQGWIQLLQDVIQILTVRGEVTLKGRPDLTLQKFAYASDLGASPVFILRFSDRSRLKLRVCVDLNVKERILEFLRAAERNGCEHVARLVSDNGLAILKTYIEGALITTFDDSDRPEFIFKAGVALAQVNAISVERPIGDMSFGAIGEQSLLIFSADNYNTIVTGARDVAFIDLEACNFGSRWIDVQWSLEQLCKNPDETKMFWRGYFSVYHGEKPTNAESEMARLNYKLWLTYQLQNSKRVHDTDGPKSRLIEQICLDLWNCH